MIPRWLALLSIGAGVLAGVAFPGSVIGNPTGAQLAVALTPPTEASGSSAELNCGWHTICLSPYASGLGLDWEDSKASRPSSGNSWYSGAFST